MHGSTELKHSFTATQALPCHLATKHVFVCHFLVVTWLSFAALSLSLCPLTATQWLSRIFRGEQWQSTETKITLHPEEASSSHHQIPKAVHLKTKYNLLTTIPEAEVMFYGTRPYTFCEDVIVFFFSLLVAAMFFSFPVVVFIQSDPSTPVCPAFRPGCILLLSSVGPENKILSIKQSVYLWETIFIYSISSLRTKYILFQDTIKGFMTQTGVMWLSLLSWSCFCKLVYSLSRSSLPTYHTTNTILLPKMLTKAPHVYQSALKNCPQEMHYLFLFE